MSQQAKSPYQNTFFLLFVAALFVSSTGTWLFTIGSGWLMTDLGSSALMVSLVQTATLIPIFIFALPAGAIGDIHSQKTTIIVSQSAMIVNTLIFAYIVYKGWASSWLLLTFTLINGIGAAFTRPIMAFLVPQLVSKEYLRKAVNLTGISFNLSRAIGPIFAGLLITRFSIDLPYWIDAISFGAVVAVIFFWNGEREKKKNKPSLKVAMADSIKYVSYTPAVLNSLIRALFFFFPAAALWALMPLVAKQQLSGNADLYGYLVGAAGIGAVVSVFYSERITKFFGTNNLMVGVVVLLAVCLAALGFAESKILAFIASFIAGNCWQIAFTSLLTSTQYGLPDWYGSRGMAFFLMAMSLSMGIGSGVWGFLADQTSIEISFYGAAGCGLLFSVLSYRFKLDLAEDADFQSIAELEDMELPEQVEQHDGWVQVKNTYVIKSKDDEAVQNKLKHLKNARYRSGAIDWNLLKDPDSQEVWIETYFQNSKDQLKRHRSRLTQYDADQIKSVHEWVEQNKGSVTKKILIAAKNS